VVGGTVAVEVDTVLGVHHFGSEEASDPLVAAAGQVEQEKR
jgi:hypothetical protein